MSVEISDDEFKQFEVLKKIFRHAFAERTGAFFICGHTGDKDALGLPEGILICPTYGTDINATTMYKKVDIHE